MKTTVLSGVDQRMENYLDQRKENFLYRKLVYRTSLIDFSSNDYLGLSRSAFIRQQVEKDLQNYKERSGATGSRLLNGHSALFDEVESLIADAHHAEAALIFNSGFDANVGLIATVARPGDVLFYDELVHASIHQGMKLSGATLVSYKHNDLQDLESKLQTSTCEVGFIVTESLFSMEGDRADLPKLAQLASTYEVELIVDEAHAIGLFGENGSGLCNEAGIESQCFARVYTFGKAIGSHGAAVAGSAKLKEYLINFSKNFIYSTALETFTLLRVKHAYFLLQCGINQCIKLQSLIAYFIDKIALLKMRYRLCGNGPVFGLIVGDNERCKHLANYLQQQSLDVRAILSPTVPKGTERLRIILHSFNTTDEIDLLINLLNK